MVRKIFTGTKTAEWTVEYLAILGVVVVGVTCSRDVNVIRSRQAATALSLGTKVPQWHQGMFSKWPPRLDVLSLKPNVSLKPWP